MALICILAALILFVLATFGVSSGRFNLVAAGLAFLTLYMVLGAGIL
jgi:hypothetical protein